jgi:hypothetical protein
MEPSAEKIGWIIRRYIQTPSIFGMGRVNPGINIYNHFLSNHTFAWTIYTDHELKIEIGRQLVEETTRLIKYHAVTTPRTIDSYNTECLNENANAAYGFLKCNFPFIWTIYDDSVINKIIKNENVVCMT